MCFKKIISIFYKEKPRQREVDKGMANVVNSMFLSAPIYDKLKVLCHPDRFIDENKKKLAESLFQELQENKYNYEKLLELESKIDDFINDKII